MSLKSFLFGTRTGKALLGMAAIFNVLSFASGAYQAARFSKMARADHLQVDGKAVLLTAVALPALTGMSPIMREGRITGIFEKGSTPNHWIDNTVITVTDPLIGYDNAQMAGLAVMAADNLVSFPGSLAGVATGIVWDKATGGLFVPDVFHMLQP